MSPLLSHTDRKGTRAGHLSKVVPITWCFFHYMVSVLDAVKADSGKRGSGKTDYRHHAKTWRRFSESGSMLLNVVLSSRTYKIEGRPFLEGKHCLHF
jgi:hypothetical protein